MAAARVRAAEGRIRPISRNCCGAARTGSGGFCRAGSAPAAASPSSSSRSSSSGWPAASTACCPTRSGWSCALAPTTGRPSRASTIILPSPIEKALTPSVTRVNRTEIGYRAGRGHEPPAGAAARQVPEEALMLTGDENIVDINFTVFWVIKDANAYLFDIRDPDADGQIRRRERDARGHRRNPDRPGAGRRAGQDRGRHAKAVAVASSTAYRRRHRRSPNCSCSGSIRRGRSHRRVSRCAGARWPTAPGCATRPRPTATASSPGPAAMPRADRAAGRSLSAGDRSPARRATPLASFRSTTPSRRRRT